MVLSGQKRSKVLPRRHVSSIPGLLHHSQWLHHAFAALEREESRAQRRLSLNAQPSRCGASLSASAATTTATAAVTTTVTNKPLVFRKTKREIERERALQAQQQREQCEQQQQQLDNMATSMLASCIRPALAKLRPSCRAEFLRDARSLRIGERGRSRRRLMF